MITTMTHDYAYLDRQALIHGATRIIDLEPILTRLSYFIVGLAVGLTAGLSLGAI